MASGLALRVSRDGHFLAVACGAGNSGFNRADQWARCPARKGRIGALNIVRGKQFGKPCMGGLCFGCHHHAGCQLVEAVDNTRALNPANAGQLAFAVVEQSVDQRARPCARRRVNGHACSLVDDDQMVVLMQDIQRYVFRFRRCGDRCRHLQIIDAKSDDLGAGVIDGLIINFKRASLNQSFGSRAGQGFKLLGEPEIEACTSIIGAGSGGENLHDRGCSRLNRYGHLLLVIALSMCHVVERNWRQAIWQK